MKLRRMKIINNCVYETIISSYGPDKKPNAAPFGVIFKNSKVFHISLYKGSTTLNNLVFSKCGVVNITHDIELFYRTSFKEDYEDITVKESLFQKAESVNAPLIASADFNLEFTIDEVKEESFKTFMVCRIVKIKENTNAIVQPCTRGFFATLESIIHSTRIKYFFKEGKNAEAEKLIKLIGHYREVAKRVSPNSIYVKIIEKLMRRFDTWRRTSASNN
jgi:hypothetical protein